MQLYLQFGHGMMSHSETLVREWGGGVVVLSPRDLERERLVDMGRRIAKAGGEALLDPQCFVRDANHSRLTSHAYWQAFRQVSTATLGTPEGALDLLQGLIDLNQEVGTTRVILPGVLAEQVTPEWLALHRQFVEVACTQLPPEHVVATIALTEAAIRDEDQIEAVVEEALRWPCKSVYLVCEAPGAYFVEDPVWLANALILAAGLRLGAKTVIVGYGNHQLLAMAAAHVDAVASGTWLNVRAFLADKFYNRDEDEVSRRAIWYYCPQALSEYKLPFLDIAQRNGVLPMMSPMPQLGSTYADALFKGAPPSSVKWGESNAFRHYLTCLRGQCQAATRGSFLETLDAQVHSLESARQLLVKLKAGGVRGQDRDFSDCVDVNAASLVTLDRALGARLRQAW